MVVGPAAPVEVGVLGGEEGGGEGEAAVDSFMEVLRRRVVDERDERLVAEASVGGGGEGEEHGFRVLAPVKALRRGGSSIYG